MSALYNLNRCMKGYKDKSINTSELYRHMIGLKAHVTAHMKQTPYYLSDNLTVKEKCSIVCGLHIVDQSPNRVMHIHVSPNVESLYIICNTQFIDKVVLLSPYETMKVDIVTLYSTVPVELNTVSCSGQLVVPAGTSIIKSVMESLGWFHYYSCNSEEHNQYRLDFLHLFPDSCDEFDFYFRKTDRMSLSQIYSISPAQERFNAISQPTRRCSLEASPTSPQRSPTMVTFGPDEICHFS